jgi:1-acyl-sn-glycerol-3-phosphate acyltransferase
MTGSAPRPRRRDRVVVFLARLLARAFYRSVDVAGEPPAGGRVILAASHLNGFVDPVLLVARLGRLPRFLAKSTLWSVPPARVILNFLGAVPVQRRVDAGDATDNRATFAAAVEALEQRHTVAVFPEGTTHDDPGIRPLRTGVARIALAASAAGVDGVRIVPVGISYEDKVSARGRALIEFGPPIAVPDGASLDDTGAPRHDEVDDLTARLEVAIRAATPDFASTEEAVGVTAGAAIALRPPGTSPDAVRMADRAVLARRVTAAGPDATGRVVDAAGRYQLLLGTVGLVDAQVANGRTITYMARHTAVLAALVVILAPFALAGLFTNLLPAVVVLVAGVLPRAPVTKGTVRLLVAAVVFPATWLAIAVWDVRPGWWSSVLRSLEFPLHPVIVEAFGTREGFWPSLFVFVSIPVLGFLALLFVERVWALLRDWRAWRARVDRRGQLDHILDRRATVAALTLEVAGGGAVSRPAGALGPKPGEPTPAEDRARVAAVPGDAGRGGEAGGDVGRSGEARAGSGGPVDG